MCAGVGRSLPPISPEMAKTEFPCTYQTWGSLSGKGSWVEGDAACSVVLPGLHFVTLCLLQAAMPWHKPSAVCPGEQDINGMCQQCLLIFNT